MGLGTYLCFRVKREPKRDKGMRNLQDTVCHADSESNSGATGSLYPTLSDVSGVNLMDCEVTDDKAPLLVPERVNTTNDRSVSKDIVCLVDQERRIKVLEESHGDASSSTSCISHKSFCCKLTCQRWKAILCGRCKPGCGLSCKCRFLYNPTRPATDHKQESTTKSTDEMRNMVWPAPLIPPISQLCGLPSHHPFYFPNRVHKVKDLDFLKLHPSAKYLTLLNDGSCFYYWNHSVVIRNVLQYTEVIVHDVTNVVSLQEIAGRLYVIKHVGDEIICCQLYQFPYLGLREVCRFKIDNYAGEADHYMGGEPLVALDDISKQIMYIGYSFIDYLIHVYTFDGTFSHTVGLEEECPMWIKYAGSNSVIIRTMGQRGCYSYLSKYSTTPGGQCLWKVKFYCLFDVSVDCNSGLSYCYVFQLASNESDVNNKETPIPVQVLGARGELLITLYPFHRLVKGDPPLQIYVNSRNLLLDNGLTSYHRIWSQ